jgi:hypothetical protein
MRHLGSVVLAVILAPLVYATAGLAAIKLDQAHVTSGSVNWGNAEIGVVAGVVAGALYAILVMSPVSPLGPGVVGLAYLGVTVWAYTADANFLRVSTVDISGVHDILQRPVGAGTLLLAMPLLATMFIPRRWSPTPRPGLPYDAAPVYPPAPGSAAPAYDDPPTLATPKYDPYPAFVYQPTPYEPNPYEPNPYEPGQPPTSEGPTAP